MSRRTESADRGGSVGRPSGIDALRQSPEFGGSDEPLDDHVRSNDHFAVIYESADGQFDGDGIGIDPEKADRILEVFDRLHHDDHYPGTGIGRSLSQEIVEDWVESVPGEGSTFSFTPARAATDR